MMVGGRANTAPSYSDAEFGIVFIGADLSSEAAAMNTAVQTYMSNL